MSTDTTLDTPASAGTLPAPSAAGTRPHGHAHTTARKSRWKPVAGAIAGAAVLAWLGQLAVHAYHFEETDDAYVVGHLHQVSPRINGYVTQVLVHDNEEVKAGDPLVRIDAQESELAASKARATLAQVQAQEGQARAALTQVDAQFAEANARTQQAQAQLAQTEAQLELARLTLNRYEELFQKNGVVAQSDLDNARSVYRAAEAGNAANRANLVAAQASVNSAQAAQKSAEAQIAAAEANVTVAETAVRDVERTLGYTTIVAPTDGRVGGKSVEIGNQIIAGQILFSIAAPDRWIVANFKETQLARMHAGSEVDLTVDALPGTALHGTIDSIAPASGAQFALLPADNATGNFNKVVQRVPVKIVLDAASLQILGPRLRLGLSVVVNVRVR